jgi:hypothetical protein
VSKAGEHRYGRGSGQSYVHKADTLTFLHCGVTVFLVSHIREAGLSLGISSWGVDK